MARRCELDEPAAIASRECLSRPRYPGGARLGARRFSWPERLCAFFGQVRSLRRLTGLLVEDASEVGRGAFPLGLAIDHERRAPQPRPAGHRAQSRRPRRGCRCRWRGSSSGSQPSAGAPASTQRAKSAMRGSRSGFVVDQLRSAVLAASSRAPSTPGRLASNAALSSALGAAIVVGDLLQLDQQRAIHRITAGQDRLDAGQENGALGVDQRLVSVGVERALGQSASRWPGGTGASLSQTGRCDRLSRATTAPLVAAISSSPSSRGSVRSGETFGSMSERSMRPSVVLAVPCSPARSRIGYGSRRAAARPAARRRSGQRRRRS